MTDNYSEINPAYDDFLSRDPSNYLPDNGNVNTQPVRVGGSMNDVVISTYIRSSNWSPKTTGFNIDGLSGHAEFCDVFVSGNIQALTGIIGGFTIGATDLTATSGGNTVIISSGLTAFSAGPTGSPTVTITQAGLLSATGAKFNTIEISSNLAFPPRGTATVSTQYGSTNIDFQSSVWDTTNGISHISRYVMVTAAGSGVYGSEPNQMELIYINSAGVQQGVMTWDGVNKVIFPPVDGVYTLGDPSYRWNNLYLAGGLSATNKAFLSSTDTDAPVQITTSTLVSSHFYKKINMQGITVWISIDGTTPNGNLSGSTSDLCLGGPGGHTYYCVTGTTWNVLGGSSLQYNSEQTYNTNETSTFTPGFTPKMIFFYGYAANSGTLEFAYTNGQGGATGPTAGASNCMYLKLASIGGGNYAFSNLEMTTTNTKLTDIFDGANHIVTTNIDSWNPTTVVCSVVVHAGWILNGNFVITG